ncbi:sterol esterase [Saccharomycopsis crataegensis]|uniref:Sterol esterase n=1 Tax=Saccharomycopsis crataegensis TaxID=43959 RepID=A0AAV5QR52_9ASCO|nr:sterol esterase [Saccharomycopsis crataegensis]
MTIEEEDLGDLSYTIPSSPDDISARLENDVRYLQVPDKVHYSPLQITIYRITSAISSFIFLSILMSLAILRSSIKKLTRGSTNKNSPNMRSPHKPVAPLSKAEKKLVPRLEYYFEIHGLNLLVYKITTDDGFILTLQRVIDPHEPEEITKKRKPVLLLHGLLQSSGAYATSGPDNSLSFFLHRQGYDVWLGNNRCGFEPQHAYLDESDPNMWNWNIYNMARYDLPVMIDQIISRTHKHNKVTLIAHSQGTTQTFLTLLAKNAIAYNHNLNDKLRCFIALSPAVFGGELLRTKNFIKFMNMLPKSMFNYVFGIHSFMPIMMHMRTVLVRTRVFGFLSYSMFNFLFDWDDSLWDKRLRTRHFVFSPVYISSRLMLWWLNNEDGFIKNSTTIFNFKEKWFDTHTPPIYLFVPGKDKLVDGEMLIDHFDRYETDLTEFRYKRIEHYSHLDVLWATDVIETIGQPIVEFLKELDEIDMN